MASPRGVPYWASRNLIICYLGISEFIKANIFYTSSEDIWLESSFSLFLISYTILKGILSANNFHPYSVADFKSLMV